MTKNRGYGLCTSTGSLNTCYLNAPFGTAFVASISQCQHTKRVISSDSKISVLEQHAECNQTIPIDTATIDGHEYDLTGPDRLKIMDDLVSIPAAEFAVKWASMYRGPVSEATPTTLVTVATPATSNGA